MLDPKADEEPQQESWAAEHMTSLAASSCITRCNSTPLARLSNLARWHGRYAASGLLSCFSHPSKMLLQLQWLLHVIIEWILLSQEQTA